MTVEPDAPWILTDLHFSADKLRLIDLEAGKSNPDNNCSTCKHFELVPGRVRPLRNGQNIPMGNCRKSLRRYGSKDPQFNNYREEMDLVEVRHVCSSWEATSTSV